MKTKKSITSRIGKYVVEILIIIIGITLSFALNEWNERQSDEEDYFGYLQSLKQDIKIDSLQMVSDYRNYYSISEGTDLILRYDDQYRNDSLPSLALAIDGLTRYIEFLPNINTYEMLSSTGEFKVFKNKELVKEIIQLYKYDYEFIRMMGEEAHTKRRTMIDPYLVKKIVFEDRETFPDIKTDVKQLINDPVFRNLCYTYGDSSWSAANSYKRAIKRLRKVDKMIDEELKRR